MRRSEKGAGSAKLIFAIVFLALVGWTAFKVIPVYVANYELNNNIHDLAIQATVDRASVEAVQDHVLGYAKDLDLPITREDIKVAVGSRVTIDIDYKVPIDLKFYSFEMHFTPSASNNAL
jgi:YbbR domain-containing protein